MGRASDLSSNVPDEKVFEGKTASKFTDPCKKAAALSMKCLEENSYDRSKCTYAFNNYRECKKAFITQRKAWGTAEESR